MGDRGATATPTTPAAATRKCNRWEIGGQPQPSVYPEADGVQPATFVQRRPTGNGAAYDDRHSCVGRNPFGAQAPQTGRRPSPWTPMRHVIPAKAGTYWRPSVRENGTYPSASRGAAPYNRHSRVGGIPASLSDGAQPRLHVSPCATSFPRKREPTPSLAPPPHSALICAQKALVQRSRSAHSALTECSRPSGRRRPPPSPSGASTQPRESRNPRARRKPVSPPSPSRSLNYDTTPLRSATPPAILDTNRASRPPRPRRGVISNERF